MGRIEIVPRRNRMDHWHLSEQAINSAIQSVEQLEADERLTNAVIKLTEAQNLVADYIDEKRRATTQSRLNEFEEALIKLDQEESLSVLEYRLQKAAIESTIADLKCELMMLES